MEILMTKNQRRKRKQQQAFQTYKIATNTKSDWAQEQANVDYVSRLTEHNELLDLLDD